MSKPAYDPTSIGNLSRIFRGVTEQAVAAALKLQRTQAGLRIADALVYIGVIRADDARWLLAKQEQMRAAPSSEDVGRVLDYACEVTQKVSW